MRRMRLDLQLSLLSLMGFVSGPEQTPNQINQSVAVEHKQGSAKIRMACLDGLGPEAAR